MSQLKKSGVKLKPLAETDIEQVRQWRNAPQISSNMEFQQHISAEQQQAWFQSLINNTCYYFIIQAKGKSIGLAHLNLFDEVNKSANVGLFIGDENFAGTGAALAASVLLLDFAFEELKLNFLTAKVKSTNTEAIQYNAFLGFIFSKNLNAEFDSYELSGKNYLSRKQVILQMLQ